MEEIVLIHEIPGRFDWFTGGGFGGLPPFILHVNAIMALRL
jgi:hypothetical protein